MFYRIALLAAVFLFLSQFSTNVFGQDPLINEIEENLGKPISSIKITGTDRTKNYVVLRELGFLEGDKINAKDIETIRLRLEKLRIFSKIEINHNESGILNIELEEKWTTIPIFKFASGGGVSKLTVGVYDPNVLGHYKELGSQVSKLGDTTSGVAWYKDPCFFKTKHGIDIQYWNTNRIRTKYDQTVDEAVPKNGFLHEREMVYLGYTYRFNDYFSAKGFYEYNGDSFSDEFLTDEIKALLDVEGLPPDTELNFGGIKLEYDQLTQVRQLWKGFSSHFTYKYGFPSTQGIGEFGSIDLTANFHKILKPDLGFSQRLMFGTTNTEVLQYWNYLGGLDRIRGFSDNRFAGRYYLLSNSEFRHNLIFKPNYVIQLVGFLDLISATEEHKDLYTLEGSSLGGGLRVILPKIYRFVVRLDYAQPIKKDDDINFSFGIQQFF